MNSSCLCDFYSHQLFEYFLSTYLLSLSTIPLIAILLVIVLSIYLGCSFRFIVNPTANSLDPGFYDSESPVPWEFIDCVIVPHTDTRTTSQSSMQEDHRGTYSRPGGPCPICLGELKIPRMTKCGHLFWWETFRLPARYSALLCNAMHCTALHCTALHCAILLLLTYK